MKENEDFNLRKSDYEIMKFPKAEKIESEDLTRAENIINVFNIPSKELRQYHLFQAKAKIWKVVKSIQSLNAKQMQKYLRKKYIMDPYNSALRFFIDTLIVTLILFDLVISPFKYFAIDSKTNPNHNREIVFDAFFLIEIISNCLTGYYETTDLFLITNIKLIIINYLRKGFVFDLMYTLPFWLISPKLVILRMIKIYRFPYIVSVIQQMILFFSSFCIHHFKLKIITKEIFSFGFTVLYVIHVFSCIYIYIARQYPDNNWITGNELNFDNVLEIYVSSVYLLTQTFSTTGYGDLKPVNNAEVLFVIISQAIFCGLFNYLITCILLVLISHLDTLSFKYKTELSLYLWMKKYTSRLPSSTQLFLLTNTMWDNVTNYFDLYYGTRNNFEWINLFPFLMEIKPNDRNDLMKCTFNNTVQHFASFFNGMKQTTQNQIILQFKTNIQNAQFTLIKENRKMKRVFFIEKGTVVILKGNKEICQLSEGQIFGLLGLINQYSEYSYEISIDSDYAHLYSISLKDLKLILSYDDISYDIALNQAFDMSYSLKEMVRKSSESNESAYLSLRNISDERMEIVPNIPNYNEKKRDKDDRDNNIMKNERQLKIDEIGLGNNDKLNLALNEVIIKEKELLDLELRLDLICNQVSYLNKYSF